MKRCPSGKVKHATQTAAQKALYAKVASTHIVGRTYRCPDCHAWHTTRSTS